MPVEGFNERSCFCRNDGVLHAEGVPLPRIARRVGTPVYVYSAGALRHAARSFPDALSLVPRSRFATEREIDVVRREDLAVLHTAGAYGAAMSSTYNRRKLTPQVLVEGESFNEVGSEIAAWPETAF